MFLLSGDFPITSWGDGLSGRGKAVEMLGYSLLDSVYIRHYH